MAFFLKILSVMCLSFLIQYYHSSPLTPKLESTPPQFYPLSLLCLCYLAIKSTNKNNDQLSPVIYPQCYNSNTFILREINSYITEFKACSMRSFFIVYFAEDSDMYRDIQLWSNCIEKLTLEF